MRRLEVDQPARGGGPQLGSRVFFGQPIKLLLQRRSQAVLELHAFDRQPMIERRRDSVEIFEQALRMIGDRECVDPTRPGVETNRVALDLDQTGDPAVDDGIQFGQGMTQAHPGLRIARAIPQEPRQPASRHALAPRETQTGEQCPGFSRAWQNVIAARSYGSHRADKIKFWFCFRIGPDARNFYSRTGK